MDPYMRVILPAYDCVWMIITSIIFAMILRINYARAMADTLHMLAFAISLTILLELIER